MKILYSRKIWRFGGVPYIVIVTAKLKSTNISYLHIYMYVWQSLP